jgi:hypothetical protein
MHRLKKCFLSLLICFHKTYQSWVLTAILQNSHKINSNLNFRVFLKISVLSHIAANYLTANVTSTRQGTAHVIIF